MLFVQTTKTMTTTTTTTTTASICHRMIAHHNSRFLSSTSLSSQSNSIVPRLLARHRRLSLQQHQRQRQPSLIGIRQYHHAMMSTRSNLCRRMGISAYYAQRSLFTVSIGIGCAWWMSPSSLSSLSSDCEAIMVVADDNNNDDAFVIATSGVRMIDDDTTEGINNNDDERTTLLSRIKRALKMIRRILKLTIVFSPVVVLYPLHLLTWRIFVGNNDENNNKVTDDAHDLALNSISFNDSSSLKSIGWYYRLCLHCVEYSGAACIKIMQWAGSRPDMFGHNFCAVFSKLQDSTKPHSWQYTKRAMKDAYGENWEEKIKLDQNDILGSGCIGQVYKGVIFDDDDDDDDDGVGVGVGVDSDINERKNGKVNNNVNNVNVVNSNKEVKKNKKKERPVAVKIMHPHVEKDIDADLDILRLTVHALEHMNIGPVKNLKWLNLPGFIEEMAIMLKIQLDLRTEGEHLIQFNKNFGCDGDENNKKYQSIVFPKLIHEYPPTKHVLMETFCEGQPVMDFIRTNKADQKLLTTMCTEAIKAVCQMIFIGE
jgi:predicted unusual protein kinase regulating ubiquinone biosynthesis (AarF/ABC1/UbiB family)